MPFGNVYSFIDGSCHNATGTPYFYGTYKDLSFQDIQSHPYASLTLSEASLSTTCRSRTDPVVEASCTVQGGDPESPLCARLTMSGRMVEVSSSSFEDRDEFEFARQAFFTRHPQMATWPEDHHWVVAKLVVTDIALIDYFGGATFLAPDEYFAVTPPAIVGASREGAADDMNEISKTERVRRDN